MSEEITLGSLKQEIRREGIRGTINSHKNFPLPTRLLKELYENEPDTIDIQFIASYPTSPSLILEQIAETCEDEEILACLAINPRTPQLILNRLSHNQSPGIRLSIAGNRLISARDFESLIQDTNESVRRALATNQGLKGFQQAQLAEDPAAAVRMALVQNKALELPILIKLSQDPSVIVRTHVVTKAKVDDDVLFHWANSNIEEIQLALFSRRNITDAIYNLLRFSPHTSVRKLARNKAKIKEEEYLWLVESESVEDRMFLLECPNIPVAIQRILAQDSAISVRIKLSLYPELDSKLAHEIATNGELSTCLAMVNNPKIDSEVIDALSRHENLDVIKRVLYREDLNQAHIETILNKRGEKILWDHLAIQDIHLPKIPIELANQWIQSKKASVRAMGAQAICLSDQQIEALTNDPSHLVRAGVAKNHNIPPKLLIQLEEDEHPEVVETVKIAMKQLQKISQENSIQLHNPEKTTESKEETFEETRTSTKKRGFFNQIAALILD